MQTTGHSGVDIGSTFGAGDVQHWSWTGRLSGDTGEEVCYRTIINFGPDEGIEISLSDGTNAYEANFKKDQLHKICENLCIAHVDPGQRISRIQAALKSDEKETTRVIKNGNDLEVRISAPWGGEFGDLSIKLDIAGIPIQPSAREVSFLDFAFESVGRAGALLREMREPNRDLKLEVEELWEAHKRFEAITRRKNERMQVFADVVNKHKRNRAVESTK